MVRRLLPRIIAALVLLLPTSALAGGEINLFYGQKSLDEDDWGPMDTHQAIGLELTFGHEWPVAVAIDFFKTEDDTTFEGLKITGETQEIDGGVRYLFRKQKKVQPYLGGGLAFIDAEFSSMGVGISDSAVGLWIAGGVNFRIGKYFNLGLDLRSSSAEVEMVGIKGEAGGVYAGVLVGFRWGGS